MQTFTSPVHALRYFEAMADGPVSFIVDRPGAEFVRMWRYEIRSNGPSVVSTGLKRERRDPPAEHE